MVKHGHGNHWDCVEEIDKVLDEIFPSMIQKGNKIEKSEIIAKYFGDKTPTATEVFTITDEAELTTKVLVAVNPEIQINEAVCAYPFIQSKEKNIVQLEITEINEWEHLIEAVITGKTEDDQTISFFDTSYFLHKESYKIGETYDFAISALGYNVKIQEEKSLSLEGQDAIDWLEKIEEEPTYDEKGNVEPFVFHLSQFVIFMQLNKECPDDAEFLSPISSIETIRAFDKDFYKFKITLLRFPEIEINLYAKTDFFDQKPKVGDLLTGFMWLQGEKV